MPTLVDRLIQHALHQVLQPLFEPILSEGSFGFRPGRGAHQESGPFRVLGDLRPAFSRSHVRRKALIGGTAGLFFGALRRYRPAASTRTTLGAALGAGQTVTKSTSQNALKRLQEADLTVKLEHGQYRLQDDAEEFL